MSSRLSSCLTQNGKIAMFHNFGSRQIHSSALLWQSFRILPSCHSEILGFEISLLSNPFQQYFLQAEARKECPLKVSFILSHTKRQNCNVPQLWESSDTLFSFALAKFQNLAILPFRDIRLERSLRSNPFQQYFLQAEARKECPLKGFFLLSHTKRQNCNVPQLWESA